MKEYTIRHVPKQDFSQIVALDKVGNPTSVWIEEDYERITNSGLCTILGAYSGACMHAYISIFTLVDIFEVISIITQPEHQNKGLGRRLLYTLINEAVARNNIVAIQLEVRSSNLPARTLYQKVGFIEQGVRRAYYSSPEEDAILYAYHITNNLLE